MKERNLINRSKQTRVTTTSTRDLSDIITDLASLTEHKQISDLDDVGETIDISDVVAMDTYRDGGVPLTRKANLRDMILAVINGDETLTIVNNLSLAQPEPTANAHATRKSYVDGLYNELLTVIEEMITVGGDSDVAHLSGKETFTGSKTFMLPVTGVVPLSDNHLTTKQYVDSADNALNEELTSKIDANTTLIETINSTEGGSGVAHLAGTETFSGAKTFTSPVTGTTPTSSAHLTTKQYVDEQVSGNGLYLSKTEDTATDYSITAEDFYVLSDRRLKTDLQPLNNSVTMLKQINSYSYFKGSDKREVGVIAQDVQKVLPEAVNEDKDGILSVKPQALISLLIDVVKQQQERIEALEEKL